MPKRLAAVLGGFAVALAIAAAAGAATVVRVTGGLDSPRGLAFLANGTLAVAEAGHGGAVCLGSGGPCYGLSSRISTIDLATGTHTPLVTGLLSGIDSAGNAEGVDGLSAQAGRLVGIVSGYPIALDKVNCAGLPGDCPAVIAAAANELGQLIEVSGSGQWQPLAQVGAFDHAFTAANPGGDEFGHEIDANPYGVLAQASGTFVADAGSNTLDWVDNTGGISVVNRFPVPNPPQAYPTDATPTCVAQGAGGLTVGDLAGRIWQLRGGSWQLLGRQQNMRHFTGCAADAAGDVYFVSMFSGRTPTALTGSIVELAAGGRISTLSIDAPLLFPNGIAIGPAGALYVSVGSVCGATAGGTCGESTGGVVKIDLTPPPVALGKAHLLRSGVGWGTAHPSRIFNGGDPAGLAFKLRWRGWGSPEAYAQGLTWISRPKGGYYAKPGVIELRADRIGRCTADGPRAYTRLRARVVAKPGGKLGTWFAWGGWKTICRLP
jgi:hypothetical protein